MKKIFIIDGNSYIHRAYHALKPLSTRDGFPTHAIYGFTKMLLKILEENPEYIAVVFDVAKKSFRNEIFPDYKANRPPMDDSLVVQIPFIKKIVKALNIPVIEEEDVEADDVIASLVSQFKHEKDCEIIIISGDKDLMALLGDNVKMWDTMRDIIYTEEEVKNKFGIAKDFLVDYFALVGDKIDNIPGVKGIGPKAAAELINEFGTIENIYNSIDKIKKERIKKALLENKENAFLSKKLIKLRDNLNLRLDKNLLKIKEPDLNSLKELFKQLEFDSLLEKFGIKSDDKNIDYKEIYEFPKSKTLSFYFEKYYDGFNNQIFIGLSSNGKEVFFTKNEKDFSELKNSKLICYNFKESLKKIKNLSYLEFDDVLLLSYLLDPERKNSIEFLSYFYLDKKVKPIEEYKKKKNVKLDFSGLKEEEKKQFIAERVVAIFNIYEKIQSQISKEEKLKGLYDKIDKPLIFVLKRMEENGILIDVKFLKDMNFQIEKEIAELTEKIYDIAGIRFNINSTKQLREILFEKLGLPVLKKTKTGPSTDNEVLVELAFSHPLPELILNYREKVKLKSTYIEALIDIVDRKTKRIYPTFHQTVTATGRLSCSNPNVQNIPIKGEQGALVRKAFIAPKGYKIVAADYSQIELRIFAHYSKDATLIEAFKKNIDIHKLTASKIYNVSIEEVDDFMRREGKTVNFSIIYGISPYGLSKALKISREKAKTFIENYFKEYPGVKEFIDKTIEEVKKKGYVENYYGRKRYIKGIDSKSHNEREFAKRAAINTIIQGTAADIIKIAMLKIDKIIDKFDAKMIMQIHDELIFEVPEDKVFEFSKQVKDIMENIIELNVPLEVSVGYANNWFDVH